MFGDFDYFFSIHKHKLDACKYPFYVEKCTVAVRRLFLEEDISDREATLLEAKTGLSVSEWKRIIQEYNESCRYTTIEEDGIQYICTAI